MTAVRFELPPPPCRRTTAAPFETGKDDPIRRQEPCILIGEAKLGGEGGTDIHAGSVGGDEGHGEGVVHEDEGKQGDGEHRQGPPALEAVQERRQRAGSRD